MNSPTPQPPKFSLNPLTPWISPSETVKLIQAISAIPALPVMVFLRKNIGFRRLKLTYVLPIALLIFFFGVFSTNWTLIAFGLAFGIMGYYQNWRSWTDLKKGKLWHTYSDGISWLEYLPLPEFLYEEERIYRFLDPLAGYAVSVLLWAIPITRPLATGLFFSAVFLAIHQQQGYDFRLNQWLDFNDNQANMEAVSSWSRRAQKKQKATVPMRDVESYGISTGVGADIRKRIEERRPRIAEAQREIKAFEITEEAMYAPPPTVTPPAAPIPPPAATPATEEPTITGAPAQRYQPPSDLDNLD
jgi:hypothetical protein